MNIFLLFLIFSSRASAPRYRVCLPTPTSRGDILVGSHVFFMKIDFLLIFMKKSMVFIDFCLISCAFWEHLSKSATKLSRRWEEILISGLLWRHLTIIGYGVKLFRKKNFSGKLFFWCTFTKILDFQRPRFVKTCYIPRYSVKNWWKNQKIQKIKIF